MTREGSVTNSEREFIWRVMSDYFVDNEVDYIQAASDLKRFPIAILKNIFFREVAPVCGPNILTPIPSIWAGFDSDLLICEIRNMFENNKKPACVRVRYEVSIFLYRLLLASLWRDIEKTLK